MTFGNFTFRLSDPAEFRAESVRGAMKLSFSEGKMAPKVGLEPTTDRLTADCSTIELLWIPIELAIYKPPILASIGFGQRSVAAAQRSGPNRARLSAGEPARFFSGGIAASLGLHPEG